MPVKSLSSSQNSAGTRTPKAAITNNDQDLWSVRGACGSEKVRSFTDSNLGSQVKPSVEQRDEFIFSRPYNKLAAKISESIPEEEEDKTNGVETELITKSEHKRPRMDVETDLSRENTPWQYDHKIQTILKFSKKSVNNINRPPSPRVEDYKLTSRVKPNPSLLCLPRLPLLPNHIEKENTNSIPVPVLVASLQSRLCTHTGEDSCAVPSAPTRFTPESFGSLRVLGQFNRGFIICHLHSQQGKYIVIDQHAADEKKNYEKLQRELKISTQTLLIPTVLHLTVLEGLTLLTNLAVFKIAGFDLEVEEDIRVNGYKVIVKGMPHLAYWTYDQKDFFDLIYLLSTQTGGLIASDSDTFVVPKAKRELATKACRASIKIGEALHRESMEEVVQSLGKLKHPWNCPHGRPTTIIADNARVVMLDRQSLKNRLRITI